MRALLVSFLAIAGQACATGGALSPRAAAPDTSHVMAAIGRFGMAHACPIAADLVLTSSHVGDPMPAAPSVPMQAFRWSDETGAEGFLDPEGYAAGADLFLMRPAAGMALTHWYAIAGAPPKAGDSLWLIEYDWHSQDAALQAKPIEVHVLRVVAGNVVFKPAGREGSSGSCVLNAAGELVAVQAWSVESGYHSQVGVAPGVWGNWLHAEGRR